MPETCGDRRHEGHPDVREPVRCEAKKPHDLHRPAAIGFGEALISNKRRIPNHSIERRLFGSFPPGEEVFGLHHLAGLRAIAGLEAPSSLGGFDFQYLDAEDLVGAPANFKPDRLQAPDGGVQESAVPFPASGPGLISPPGARSVTACPMQRLPVPPHREQLR